MLGNKPEKRVITQKTALMIMFLFSQKNPGAKMYGFKKGIELPESKLLTQIIRNPRYYKDCWIMDNLGLRLTKKGYSEYLGILESHNNIHYMNINDKFGEIFSRMGTLVTDYDIELMIQLKHWQWITVGNADPLEEPDISQLKKQLGLKPEDKLEVDPKIQLDPNNPKHQIIIHNRNWSIQQVRRAVMAERLKTFDNLMNKYNNGEQ